LDRREIGGLNAGQARQAYREAIGGGDPQNLQIQILIDWNL
jgi:hypothetical protein